MLHGMSLARLAGSLALFAVPLFACGDDANGGTGGLGGTAGSAGTTGLGGTGGASSGGLPSGAGGTTTSGGAGSGATASGGTGGAPPSAGAGGTDVGTAGNGQAGGPPASGKACDPQLHTGEATYYDADGSGNCSFAKAPGDVNVAAMNATDYAASATCGTCLAVKGPQGNVRVRIVDQCPECKPGDVDMHPGAFDQIAERSAGRVKIEWTYVSCEGGAPLTYHFKDGSNPYWTAVQIRNHTNAIAKIEYRAKDGSYKAMVRQSYNYFLEDKGLGDKGPYALRVTDVFGHVIEDDAIPSIAEGDYPSTKQFPACIP